MQSQRSFLTHAVLTALTTLSSSAFTQTATTTDATLPAITVTTAPFDYGVNQQLLAPASVLRGDALRNKLGNSLGDTLSQELGVSASASGAGASRPVIRGMEGPRVKILQNGMSIMDASSLSNDHAVGGEAATARQIEILRGPAALLYGSGAIGGVVNIVNDRIPTVLNSQATGSAEVRLGSVDQTKNTSLSVDGAAGNIGLHIDGNLRDANDYQIPGHANLNDPQSASGHLPNSFVHSNSVGFGASSIYDWGHIGVSVGVDDERYGIPTAEMSYITLKQTRLDLDALVKNPFVGKVGGLFESFRFKLGHTDYQHTENEQDGTPATDFKNRALESRWELTHKPLAEWRGTFGLQTENSTFSAFASDGSGPETVPMTMSNSIAGFLVEERDFGPFRATAGARLESVKRTPKSDLIKRNFNLGSYSLGGLWAFTKGYGLGLTASIAQRAPAIEELYSNGPHESTVTYDAGDAHLDKETSRNLELSLQKTDGLIRWKANVFHNHVKNYIYGRSDGTEVNQDGVVDPLTSNNEFLQRFWSQGEATIRGAEAEISYNLNGPGFSLRGFTDTSSGTLTNASNLPLQPSTRVGSEIAYREGRWHSGLSVLHAQKRERLASFEKFVTPSYTQVDANFSYTQPSRTIPVTWFIIVKNLLNDDIRLSTSVLREEASLPGRNLIVGVRTNF